MSCDPCCCCPAVDPCQKHDPCRSRSTPCRTRGQSYKNKCVPHCGLGKTEEYCCAVCVVCDRKTKVNNAIYTEQMKSGYAGHVPLSRYYLGLSFPEAAILGVAEFEQVRSRKCCPPPCCPPCVTSNCNCNNSVMSSVGGGGAGCGSGCPNLNTNPRLYAGYSCWRQNCITAPGTKELEDLTKPPENREKGVDCVLCPCPVPCASPFPCCFPPSYPSCYPGCYPSCYPNCYPCCIAQVTDKGKDREEDEDEDTDPDEKKSKIPAKSRSKCPPTKDDPKKDKDNKNSNLKSSSSKLKQNDDEEPDRVSKICAYPCPSPGCPTSPCYPSCCPFPCPCPCPCPGPCPFPCPGPCPFPCPGPCPFPCTGPCPGPCPFPCTGPCPGPCPFPCTGPCPFQCPFPPFCPCPSPCTAMCPCPPPCPCPCLPPCCCLPSMKNYETCPTPPPKPLMIYLTERMRCPRMCDDASICPPCCCYAPSPCYAICGRDENRSNNNRITDSDDEICEKPVPAAPPAVVGQPCQLKCTDECNSPFPCSRAPGVICACPCVPEEPQAMILTRNPPQTLPVTCCGCCRPSEPLNAAIYPKLASNAIAQWALMKQRTITFVPTCVKTCCLKEDPNKYVPAGCDCCGRCNCY